MHYRSNGWPSAQLLAGMSNGGDSRIFSSGSGCHSTWCVGAGDIKIDVLVVASIVMFAPAVFPKNATHRTLPTASLKRPPGFGSLH